MLNALIHKLPSVRRLQAALEETKANLHNTRKLLHDEMRRNAPRAARLIVKGGMSHASVAEALAGSENNSLMQAVSAIINGRIVELTDKACERPRESMETSNGTVPGYTAADRLYDAGGSGHMAELLADLQHLSKPKDPGAPTESE